MTARYGQLTYTSFAGTGSPGGWQVKEIAGGITDAEADLLVAGIHTSLNPVHPLPPYPTPAELAAAPRRLSYRRLDGGTAAYWHVVAAGADSSGRPGNVFAHALLDRRAALTEPRPIELWRSPHWLTPYGGKAVSAAALVDAEPVAGEAVTAESVTRFVCDREDGRLAVLGVLLDAVAAALADGPPVVLGTESVDDAAQWIGAVSFLMSPGTVRRLNFSTFERGCDLYAPGPGRHLVAVPRVDLADIPAGPVVIDEAEEVLPGEPNAGPHRTARGGVEATPFSVLARMVLTDRDRTTSVLAGIEAVSSRLADECAHSADLHPALPLALAILRGPAPVDAARAAREVVAACAPRGLGAEPAVASAVDTEVHRLVGATTADAWRAAVGSAGLVADAAAAVYLKRALADPDWLERAGPVPIPAQLPALGPDALAAVTAAVPAALTAARDHGPARLFRVVDLLVCGGLADHAGPAIDREIVPVLLDETAGPALTARLAGCIRPVTRLAVAGRIFSAVHRRGGEPRLGRELLDFLADDIAAPGAADLIRARPGDPAWTAASLLGLRALASQELPARDRYLALWWLRRNHAPPDTRLAEFDRGPWDPAELLVAAGDGPLPARACVSTLVGAADSAGLRALAERVLDANADPGAVACAAVRAVRPADWWAGGHLATYYRAYTPYWEKAIGQAGTAALHRDFAVRFLVLGALAAASGITAAAACAALAADTALAAGATAELESMVASGAVPADRLCAAARQHGGPPHDTGVGHLLNAVAARIMPNPAGADFRGHRGR